MKAKYLLPAALTCAIVASMAHAGDKTAAPQQKPPTVEELQKQVAFLSAALQDVTAQRDAYRSQLDNLQVQIDAQKKVDSAKPDR
ncbi:MAG TPA: hypothetical protein VMD53_03880 [Rhizomicrobium sp.]|nr:hypothetical protein [Rhizomicrobium sp.]